MGGGGGLRCNLKATKKPHRERLNECYGIHKDNKYLVQHAQNSNQNNAVSASNLAFTYNNLIKKIQGTFLSVRFSLQKGDV